MAWVRWSVAAFCCRLTIIFTHDISHDERREADGLTDRNHLQYLKFTFSVTLSRLASSLTRGQRLQDSSLYRSQ